MTLNDALENVAVHECDEIAEACKSADLPYADLPGWYGVSTDEGGVIAYFAEKRAAFEYRLFLVNQMLNGPNIPTKEIQP